MVVELKFVVLLLSVVPLTAKTVPPSDQSEKQNLCVASWQQFVENLEAVRTCAGTLKDKHLDEPSVWLQVHVWTLTRLLHHWSNQKNSNHRFQSPLPWSWLFLSTCESTRKKHSTA